jgi:hypothetical protein
MGAKEKEWMKRRTKEKWANEGKQGSEEETKKDRK